MALTGSVLKLDEFSIPIPTHNFFFNPDPECYNFVQSRSRLGIPNNPVLFNENICSVSGSNRELPVKQEKILA